MENRVFQKQTYRFSVYRPRSGHVPVSTFQTTDVERFTRHKSHEIDTQQRLRTCFSQLSAEIYIIVIARVCACVRRLLQDSVYDCFVTITSRYVPSST